MMNAGARMQQKRSAESRASRQKESSSAGHHYGVSTSYGGGSTGYSPSSPRTGVTPTSNYYSSEARQMPKVTYTSPSSYDFPWDDKKQIWELAGKYDKQHSKGEVTEEMLNALFKELYSKRTIFRVRFDLLKPLAIFTIGLSLIFMLGYLISGLATTYYRF